MARKPTKAGAGKPARRKPNAKAETVKPEGDTLDGGSDAEAEAIGGFRVRFEKTGNPIYVFWALSGIYSGATLRWLESDGKDEYEPKIPKWIHDYLSSVSRNIFNLTYSRDPRAAPYDIDITTPEGKAAWRAWRHESALEREKAIDLLPAALGMSRKGWNAFSNFDSIMRKEDIRDAIDELIQSNGVTLEEAAGIVAEENGFEEIQSVLRIYREVKAYSGDGIGRIPVSLKAKPRG
jgi:hypothetical protein